MDIEFDFKGDPIGGVITNCKIKSFEPVLRKPANCICKNKGAHQLHCNSAADQCLCFRYIHR